MKTWYLIGQVTKQNDLPARIRHAARRMGCLRDLDSIRLEKDWSRNKKGQGIYCALGFLDPRPEGGTTAPNPPFEAEKLLERLQMKLLKGSLLASIIPEEAAQSWMQELLASGDPVEHIVRIPPPDPADADNARDIAVREASSPDSTQHCLFNDRLLYWLSAMQTGTWQQFSDACNALGLRRFAKPGDTVARLISLGHLEISESGQRWSIAPSTVAGGPDGGWFLCGQRSESLISQLSANFGLDRDVQPKGNGPARIRLKLSGQQISEGVLNLGAYTIPIIADSALKLCHLLPHWKHWYQHVQGNYKPDLVSVDLVERVTHNGSFEVVRPKATGQGQLGVPAGLYRLTFRHGFTVQVISYCGDDGQWTRCDWNALLFLACHPNKNSVVYQSGNDVIIPADYPWPRLYERPLVLASGMLPTWVSGKGRLFSNVPSKLVTDVASKVDSSVRLVS